VSYGSFTLPPGNAVVDSGSRIRQNSGLVVGRRKGLATPATNGVPRSSYREESASVKRMTVQPSCIGSVDFVNNAS
jgi:hypothetical protein